jgi:heme/copper-type cytochrome/quinol oxidase subunit 2
MMKGWSFILVILMAGALFFIYLDSSQRSVTGNVVLEEDRQIEKEKLVEETEDRQELTIRDPAAPYEGVIDEHGVRVFNLSVNISGFHPREIKVREGEKVRIWVENVDALHGIYIPEYDAKSNTVVLFTAKGKGTYNFYSSNFVINGYGDMTGKLIVE